MWIQISSGRGPDECELAVSLFLKTMLKENSKIKMIDAVSGNISTYLPMNLSVVAREERSQYRNKKLAIARLSKMIEALNNEGSLDKRKSMWSQHNELERGNPIRVYEGQSFKERKR